MVEKQAEKHTMLNVEEVAFDTDNPRIKKALEKYGDKLNAERIHFALRSATDGDKGASSYSQLKDAKALVEQALSRIRSIREGSDTKNGHNKVELEKLDELEKKLINFKARRSRPLLGDIRASEVTTYRKVFQTLAKVSQPPQAAKEMIEAILSHS